MSLFDKCYKFTLAKEIMKSGYYPYFREITSDIDTSVSINGHKTLMFGSNSYLGLSNHPKVKDAAEKAAQTYGTGCAGSRFLNGTLDIHVELERRLAELVGKEESLLFSTGFQANVGVISTLLSSKDVIALDKLDHASIVQGALLSRSKMLRYNHNDFDELERLLKKNGLDGDLMLVTDTVFSMDGDIADLNRAVEVIKKYNGVIMVDEAHAIGVYGKRGQGLVAHFNLTDKIDLIMGTFSKSLASIGGFIAGDEPVIHYLKHFSRPFIFSASMPPPSVAAVIAAMDIMESEPERINKLWENTKYMHKGIKELGFKTSEGESPVLPIIVGDEINAFKFCVDLQKEGVFVNPAVAPAVQPGQALIRISLMATHTFEEIDFALQKMEIVGKKLGII